MCGRVASRVHCYPVCHCTDETLQYLTHGAGVCCAILVFGEDERMLLLQVQEPERSLAGQGLLSPACMIGLRLVCMYSKPLSPQWDQS